MISAMPDPVKQLRKNVHRLLDPMWQIGPWDRDQLLAEVAKRLGRETFAIADIETEDEAHDVIGIVVALRLET